MVNVEVVDESFVLMLLAIPLIFFKKVIISIVNHTQSHPTNHITIPVQKTLFPPDDFPHYPEAFG